MNTSRWSRSDEAALAEVESALTRGLALKSWWDETRARKAQRFELIRTYHQPNEGFSYFDVVPFRNRPYPVMGDFQDLFYDRPKGAGSRKQAAEWTRRQIREFVLHYLLRVLDSRAPEAFHDTAREVPLWLRPWSWCPEPYAPRQGFGFSQLYYKLRGSGVVGKFPEEERHRIVDLRELVDKYEWVVVSIRIFDFDLTFRPLGPRLPSIDIPLRERQLAVMSRDFLVDRERPVPGVLGEYGIGYALVPDPSSGSLLAYGPGHFEAGFQLLHFQVLDTGETRVRLNFMVNRPRRLLNVSLDPLAWLSELANLVPSRRQSRALRRSMGRFSGRSPDFSPFLATVAILNLLTGGLSSRQLCISRTQLEQDMLVKHFQQTYETIDDTSFTWRLVPDWLDRAALPEWVVTGLSS